MTDYGVCFTKFTHANGPLTKKFSLKDGVVHKAVAAIFTEGRYETVSVANAEEFAAYICTLETTEALSFSVCHVAPAGRVVTVKNLPKYPGAVVRTKSFFNLKIGQPGAMTLDYDPPPGAPPMTRDELWNLLCQVVPAIGQCDVVWWPSAGSCIWHGDQEKIGIRGQRFWIMVADAADIPRAGAVLLERLWQQGFGRIEISKSGSLLVRNVFDGSVWDAGRLDFASGSVVEAPLEQRRGEPVILGIGGLLDTRLILPDLTDEERAVIHGQITAAKVAVEPQRLVIKMQYDEARCQEITGRLIGQGVDHREALERAKHAVAQLGKGILMGDWVIRTVGMGLVSVAELLRNKEKYDGAECLDPEEPDYQGGKPCAKIYLFGGRPVIHSFAHGSKTYSLYPQPRKMILAPRDSENAQRLLEMADLLPDIFRTANGLVTVESDGLRVLTSLGLVCEVAKVFVCWKATGRVEIAADFPERAAKMLLEGDLSAWPPLRGILTAPFMAKNGRLVTQPGYDRESKMFLAIRPADFPLVPTQPSIDDVVSAFRQLWAPFASFPFATDDDKAAMVAALLTAVSRWGVGASPGFMFEAPTQGSGKSMAAECVKYLATGRDGLGLWPDDETELRKMLVSWVRQGRLCHIFDNVTGRFASGTLAGAMTSGVLDGERLLGGNTTVTGELCMLWLATGNNACLDRDLAERWLRIRIDAQCERPSDRAFNFNPLVEVKANRPALVTAALTILRAWHCAGRPDASTRGCRFTEWSATVRACVLWLARVLAQSGTTEVCLGDPATSLFGSDGDNETAERAEFLEALFELNKAQKIEWCFSASDLHQFVRDDKDHEGIVVGWLQGHTSKPKLNSQSISRALFNIRDKPAGGLCLRLATKSEKRVPATYRVVSMPSR